jgi:hypothetical protein
MGTPRIAFPEFRLPGIGSMTSLPVTQFPTPPMPAGHLPRTRKHASTCSDNLSEIPVGVDPMNFTVRHILRRPTALAAFRTYRNALAVDISLFFQKSVLAGNHFFDRINL